MPDYYKNIIMTLSSGGKWFGGQPIMQDNEGIDFAEGRITIWKINVTGSVIGGNSI